MVAGSVRTSLQREQSLVRRSLLSELRALLVMAQKQWLIFRRYPSWVAAFLIWPLIFPLGTIFTAHALSGPDATSLPVFVGLTGTSDYAGYIIIGLTMYTWLNITLWDVGFQLRDEQMRGTLESNWLCPVWRFSILLGPSLCKLAVSFFFLGLGAVEYWLVYGVNIVGDNPLLVLAIILLVIPSIYGIGVAFASLVVRLQEASAMVFLVRGIFMIFTGVSYPLAVMPEWMQAVGAWLPLTYAIHAIRAVALNGDGLANITSDLQMLLIFALVIPAAGYLIFRYIERRARRVGALGRY
jgi:ABC-2 type transport system permease protein